MPNAKLSYFFRKSGIQSEHARILQNLFAVTLASLLTREKGYSVRVDITDEFYITMEKAGPDLIRIKPNRPIYSAEFLEELAAKIEERDDNR